MGVAQRNGALKASNGHVNGSAKHTTPKRTPARRKRPGLFSWIFNQVARLTTWFAILTILFRCPPTLEACDESSPFVCKYYFQAKNIVVPHVQPYYDQYAAPYVEVAQPYYDSLNSHVFQPARGYAVQYGAPYVEKAQEYGLAEWEKHGQPELVKVQRILQKQYDHTVAPYIDHASFVLGPYYNAALTNGKRAIDDYVHPGYEMVQPYAVQGYEATSHFATNTALPAAWWAWGKTHAFIDTAVWPHVRVLYIQNVEPQLVRIGERLGRYKTKVKSKASDGYASNSSVVESSFSKPTQAPTSTSTVARPASTAATVQAVDDDEDDDYVKPVEAPPPAANESEKRKKAREMVAEDLELWQNKFVERADEGANDMEDRVEEIAKRMVETNAETKGKSLVNELENSVKNEVELLKRKILDAVQLAEESTDAAEDAAISAVRAAGVAIKERAQAVRTWRQSYDQELQTTVVKAADTHFQILDEIRGLALQQIGMKWAWADGVTYKDWAKYHELKSTFGEWTNQLKQLIVSHPSLLEAQEVSAQIEDESMEIAANAAKELSRLKEVAHWKIVAKDATDNYELEAAKLAAEASETVRKEAEEAAKSAAEQARKLAVKAEEEARKGAEAAARKAADAEKFAEDEARAAASAVSESVEAGTSVVADKAENFASSAASVASGASEVVFDEASSEAETASSVIADQSTAASQSVASVLSEGSSVVDETVEEPTESLASVASDVEEGVEDAYSTASDSASSIFDDASSIASDETASTEAVAEDLASEASNIIVGEEPTIVANISEVDETDEDSSEQKDQTASPDDAAKVKPVLFGAMAQDVPDRGEPILEGYQDDDDSTGIVSGLTNAAQEAYANAVAAASEQYSSAASVVSAQIYGTPKPVHEQLFASVSSAYDDAIAAASARLNGALAAASSGASNLKPTTTEATKPTPLVDWSKVESIAAQRLNEGRLWAEVQYQSAIIAMGLATPTPTSSTEKFYNQAKVNYYAGLGLAQARYNEFVSAASAAMLGLSATPTPTGISGTASSIASAAMASAASAARAAEEAAEAVYSAATENVASAVDAVDEGISSAIDAASENLYLSGVAIGEIWDHVLAGIEGRVYGEQQHIGWYDSLFSDASSAVSAATDKAGEGAAHVTAAAGDSAAAASAEAAKQYEAVTELVSELVSGKEPSFSESVLSRLNAAYATVSDSFGSYASEASAAASAAGDKVGSAASQATEAIKETINHARDEL